MMATIEEVEDLATLGAAREGRGPKETLLKGDGTWGVVHHHQTLASGS
jgi:hypothetical protein